MKIILQLVFVIILLAADALAFSKQWDNGKLKISEDGHFLIHDNGKPFIWIGNTAWEMAHFSKKEEATTYFKNRHDNGYTVVLTCALAEVQGMTRPNAYGYLPLKNNDPLQPVEEYWQHIDYVVRKAEEYDIYIALVVTWGTWLHDAKIINADNAYKFGQWIGSRYRNNPNIIYILGCDREPFMENTYDDVPLWNKLASGIKDNDPNHLMSYLPKTRSSKFLHAECWLDFNIMQTGHEKFDNPASYQWVESDYKIIPAKPTIDCEPRYEDHPVNWKEANGFFNDFDARQTAYWSLLAGAFGCNYGNRSIISWYGPDYKASLWYGNPGMFWYEALDRPGSMDMKHITNLLRSRPFLTLVPDQSIIASANPDDGRHIQAARGKGYILVYDPYGLKIEINSEKVSGKRIVSYWYNPRDGSVIKAGKFRNKTGKKSFDPPGDEERGNDWVLVLDDSSLKYPQPGKALL